MLIRKVDHPSGQFTREDGSRYNIEPVEDNRTPAQRAYDAGPQAFWNYIGDEK